MSITLNSSAVSNGILTIDASFSAPANYKLRDFYIVCGGVYAYYLVPRTYYTVGGNGNWTDNNMVLASGRDIARIPLSAWPDGDLVFSVHASYVSTLNGSILEDATDLQIAVTNNSYDPPQTLDTTTFPMGVLQAPVVTAVTAPSSIIGSTVQLEVTALDNNAVTGYKITESAVPPLATAPGWDLSASYIAASYGIKSLYAWAKDASGNISEPVAPVSVTFEQPPYVTVTPIPGTYSAAQNVTFTRANFAGGAIYYTLDGSDPTTGSAVYSDPITVTESTTLKALAVDADGNQGEVQTFAYSIMQLSAVVNVPTTQLAVAMGSMAVLAVKNTVSTVSGTSKPITSGAVIVEVSNNRTVTVPASTVLNILAGVVAISTTRSISVGIPTQNVLSIVTGQVVVAASAIGNVVIPVTGQDQNLLTGLVSIITNQVSGGRIRDKNNRVVNFWYWTGSNLAQLNMHI